MKKLALLALSMALFISSVPVTYANPTQISSTVSEEMIAMNNLGLVESTTGPIRTIVANATFSSSTCGFLLTTS